MIIYLIVQLLLLAVCFASWYIDPEVMSLGYFVFHTFPLYSAIISFIAKSKVEKNAFSVKFLGLIIPFFIWFSGVWYIYNTSPFSNH